MQNQIPIDPASSIRKDKKKHVGYVVLSLLVLLFIAVGTVVGLKFFISDVQQDSSDTASQVTFQTSPAAEVIIDEYIRSEITERSSLYTPLSVNEAPSDSNTTLPPTNGTIMYQKPSRYSTVVSASHFIQYSLKDSTGTNNNEAVKKATEAFLTSKQLTKTSVNKVSDFLTNTTYESANAVCQVADTTKNDQTPALYGVACVAKQLIEEQYEKINSLLELTPALDRASIGNAIISPVIKEGEARLITVNVTTASDAKTLYYATISDTYEYLGERPVTSPDDKASFELPSGLASKVNDPRWNGFLKKYIK